MSKEVIARLQQTGLFKRLREKENEEKIKTSLEDHEISQNVISVVCRVAPLLERIPEICLNSHCITPIIAYT